MKKTYIVFLLVSIGLFAKDVKFKKPENVYKGSILSGTNTAEPT